MFSTDSSQQLNMKHVLYIFFMFLILMGIHWVWSTHTKKEQFRKPIFSCWQHCNAFPRSAEK